MLTLTVMALAAKLGASLPGRERRPEGIGDEISTVLGATLTLLALIIGFTFSMATTRYDQRKNLEEEEANAIGTEYVRADLIHGPAAAQVRSLLRKYLDERIRFYVTPNTGVADLGKINAATSELQSSLWSAIVGPASEEPNQVKALDVSGMNDVLNTQGYVQAAWWNRIPVAAWALMSCIGVFSNLLLGYGARKARTALLLVLPMLIAISFLLIDDLDSPRGGLIRVQPNNLIALRQSLQTGP